MEFLLDSKLNLEEQCWEVTLSGEIDIFNSEMLKERLTAIIGEKNIDLHIDCKDLDYIDSTALGSLVAILKKVRHYNGNIYLFNLKSNLLKLFKITNLDKVFIIGVK